MHVRNFLCCMPLVWGVAITGIVFGSADFIIGSMGWQMVIEDHYADWLLEFFRKMPVRYCVSGFSVAFYLLASVHFMLTYGAYTDNHLLVGTWLLVNFTMLLFTLVTGLLNGYAILRIIAVGYTIIVVRSHYENLVTFSSDEESVVESSEEHSDDDI